MDVTSNGQGMLFIKFKNFEDLIQPIEDGPWLLVVQRFFVRRWARKLSMIV